MEKTIPIPWIVSWPASEGQIFTLLERGAGARTRDEFQARGAGRAGPGCPPCVRACVTLKKGPKGLQNHQETITFIDKSEKVKGFQVLK